jgi:hypothetical protein
MWKSYYSRGLKARLRVWTVSLSIRELHVADTSANIYYICIAGGGGYPYGTSHGSETELPSDMPYNFISLRAKVTTPR